MNYISWKNQIEKTLTGYDLLSYVDGTLIIPEATITTNGTTTANPALRTYMRQDGFLFGAISGTLSTAVQPLISTCNTSLEAWRTLAKTYATPSRGHIKQVKERLRNITKGTKTVTEFMGEMKNCADQLAMLGKPMDDDDLI